MRLTDRILHVHCFRANCFRANHFKARGAGIDGMIDTFYTGDNYVLHG
jgi:hypothetical protein